MEVILATHLLAAGVAFLLSTNLAPLVGRWAGRLSLLDHPGARKRHPRPVPATGGVAVFWAVAIPLLLLVAASRGGVPLPGPLTAALREEGPLFAVALLGAAVLHAAGLADDRKGLAPGVKLGAQVVATLPLILAFRMVVLPEWLPVSVGVAVTLVWFLVVINAFNFLDGMDGLMGGVALICSLELIVVGSSGRQWPTLLLLALLTGALLGFLRHNLPPARIFSGDNGSLVVGYLIAFASLRITYYDPGAGLEIPWYAVFTPVVILAFPLYDFVSVLLIRWREGRSLTRAGRDHFSHRLLKRGLGPRQALALVYACTVASGLGGIVLGRVAGWQAVLVALQAVVILFVVALLEWTTLRPPGTS